LERTRRKHSGIINTYRGVPLNKTLGGYRSLARIYAHELAI
jgi:hypothetical protein